MRNALMSFGGYEAPNIVSDSVFAAMLKAREAAMPLSAKIERTRARMAEEYSPTKGMSPLALALAGVGKGMSAPIQAVQQVTGRINRADVDEMRRRDAPLMNTFAGTAGNLLGGAATSAPLMAMPGANALMGGMVYNGLMGAAQPVGTGDSVIANAALGAAPMGPMGSSPARREAIVWHGSPHKFDKFDSSKIGTGEGAQAYGHGLYLAESPDVAGSYKAMLAGRGDAAGAVSRHIPSRQFTSDEVAAIHRAATGDDPINMAARRLGYRQASLRGVDEAALTQAIAEVRDQAQGSLYKVDLPDPLIARMLDWDKPLSQQAQSVRDALYDVAPGRYMTFPSGERRFVASPDAHMSGGAAYARAARLLDANDPMASARLREAGIPGIRYLDGGSRGAGSGTSNFVIFPGEENALTILERNGKPLR